MKMEVTAISIIEVVENECQKTAERGITLVT